MIPTWTYWLMGFVAVAAYVARLVHYWDAGRSVLAPFRKQSREAAIQNAASTTRQRFRDGAEPTWEDDLNDALRSPATDFGEEETEMILPGIEAVRGER